MKMNLYSIKNDNDLIDAVFDKDGCIIYGTGRVGKLILHSLQHLSYDSAFHKKILFAVSNESYLKPPIEGFPVKTIQEAVAQYPNYTVIFAVVSPDYQQDMMTVYRNATPPGGCGCTLAAVDVKYLAYHRTFEEIEKRIQRLEKKLSMSNDIWQIDDISFYVPNYPYDFLQRVIVDECDFYEADILKMLDKYLDRNSVVFDIGANIGNHTLYWGKRARVKKIYSFEPVLTTYQILEKNIAINKLENIVTPFNIGLSDQDGHADIEYYSMAGIGSTHLTQSENGEMIVQRLDSLPLLDQLERVDFVKIDVEGFECKVLAGGSSFFQKYKPVVFIESWEWNAAKTDSILRSYGYRRIRQVDEINYLYQHTDRR